MIFSLAWNFMFTVNWKVLVLKFLRIKNVLFFRPESWWKDDIYWSLKSSCFELFDDGKYSFFWVKKLIEKMIYTDYWETLVLNFSVMGNTIFSSAKKSTERLYLLGLFVLSMIFWDLGNTVFHAVKDCKYTWMLKELEIVVHNCFCMLCLLRLFGTCDHHQN